MDHIDKALATSSNDSYQFSPSIHAALALGKNAMNKYYNKTDQSEVYCIAMGEPPFYLFYTTFYVVSVLHPRHKLEYFKKHNWEDMWVNAASEIVHKEFNRTYAHIDFEVNGSSIQPDANLVVI
jgi:hypothetical protein